MNLSLTLIENPKDKSALFRVTLEDKGVTQIKNLTVEDTVKLLSSSTVEEKINLYDPGQPYGFVKAFFGNRADTFKVAVMYPAKKRGVRYFSETYYVPYPDILYLFEVRRGIVIEKRCFAVKDEFVTENTVLYRFPFGNVTGNTGSMCFGNIKLPKIKNMRDIDTVVSLFLSGDVNDDLWHQNISKNWKQFELFEYIQAKRTFPKSLLVKCEEGSKKALTFGDVFTLN